MLVTPFEMSLNSGVPVTETVVAPELVYIRVPVAFDTLKERDVISLKPSSILGVAEVSS